jgi:acyl carrier protein phosphodiesterase
MNFLAHLHLADPDPGLMLGGIVADFARNPEIAALPADVQAGVRLHRLIDSFTDSHPVVRGSVGRISEKYSWFSGIIIDIYYDHILARDWSRYSAEPLPDFARRAYSLLDGITRPRPGEAARFIRSFIDDDRLVRYATPEGIADTLARVSRRIAQRIPKNAIRLERPCRVLAKDDRLAADFHAFYPELMAFAARRERTGWAVNPGRQSAILSGMTEREFALDVVAKLQQAGFTALWAGGCVRDELLGLAPADYDVATDARPEQLRPLFKRRNEIGAQLRRRAGHRPPRRRPASG